MVHVRALDRSESLPLYVGAEHVELAQLACADVTSALERTAGAPLTLSVIDAADPRVESIWRALEAAARPTYFLTWGWIATWLAALPTAALPQLAVVREGATAVAACFLGRRRVRRHGVVPTRMRYLNATGIPRFDELCIEHNTMLCVPGTTWPLQALIEGLPADWDELALPAIDATPLAPPEGYQLVVDREVAAPYVDLAKVRAAGDYLSLLGGNTRAQIRRARRLVGPLALEVATTLAQALEIYDELIALHTTSWRRRGEPGAFADPWFERFHRDLITQRFAHGEIELLRLRAGGQTLGCVYNLIAHGRTLFYQAGLAPIADPRIKPGYLCQAAAIEHAAATGAAIYDFLGGDARYKAQLATGSTRLIWVRVQRRLVRFALEERVRHLRRAYLAWRAAPAPGPALARSRTRPDSIQ
jgi:CelD/BcsL family acetyltransferase involved in cellulose biosynthesis